MMPMPLYRKKGSGSSPTNYRGINFIQPINKTLAFIIFYRLNEFVEKKKQLIYRKVDISEKKYKVKNYATI